MWFAKTGGIYPLGLKSMMAPFVIEDVELIVIVIRGHTALRRTSCL